METREACFTTHCCYHLGRQGGGGLLTQFSPPPILDGKTEAREQLLLHRLTSLRLVPSQEAGAEGRGLVVVKDAVLELDDSLTR